MAEDRQRDAPMKGVKVVEWEELTIVLGEEHLEGITSEKPSKAFSKDWNFM